MSLPPAPRPMPRDRPDDPLRAISRFLHRELGWPVAKVVRFEIQMRQEFGGRKYYIRRAEPVTPAEPRRKPRHSPLPASWDGIV